MHTIARESGIEIIGSVPWGTHFCMFYKTSKDLVEIILAYFDAGLKNNEFCMCVTADPVDAAEMERLMRAAMPRFDEYVQKGQIEIVPSSQWYVIDGVFDQTRVLDGWAKKLRQAQDRGFEGARVTGNPFWFDKPIWKDFIEYEGAINGAIDGHNFLVLCSYCLDRCSANEIIDVVSTHEFAITRCDGDWKIIENSELKETKKSLLESKAHAELYLDLMAHDINNYNQTGMGYLELALDSIEDGQAKALLESAMNSFKRSTGLIENVRVLQKARAEDHPVRPVDLRQILREAKDACLIHAGKRVSVQIACPGGRVLANELLKDVFSNLLSNAAKHSSGDVDVKITAARLYEEDGIFYKVAVEDNGPGIPDSVKGRLFYRYSRGQTTARGSGLGLYLVKSLVEQYRGRVWVEDRVPGDSGQGARFVVLLPAAD